jgi:radical SAM superfamily enzyme YgiQ (UPF0313 family)
MDRMNELAEYALWFAFSPPGRLPAGVLPFPARLTATEGEPMTVTARKRPLKVKMILPALAEATDPAWRPLKYSLFPPLGLIALAGYLDADDEVTVQDEHVQKLDLDDEPDLVVIETYITSARRAYQLADHYRSRGAHVCLGGLHATSLPQEAAAHADTVFLGPGEDIWPAFLADFHVGRPRWIYQSTRPSLLGAPAPRRDLVARRRYLSPNSLVVSRGCPHSCDFCYKGAFFRCCPSFFTQRVEDALAQVESLPGRHLFFLDDNLFGSPRFAAALCDGMRGMGRVWQAAGTLTAIEQPGLLEKAAAAGLRSLFVGLESLSAANLRAQHKLQGTRDHGGIGDPRLRYEAAVRRLHDLGIMVNASFVFGLDEDDESVFAATVDWAVSQGIETATFHILTPYPGTVLHRRLESQGRITSTDWDRYDTRHAVFAPARLSAAALEEGYRRAYRDFYSWASILRAGRVADGPRARLRHVAVTAGWKKCEPLWDLAIRAGGLALALPLLEVVLGDARREHGSPGAAAGSERAHASAEAAGRCGPTQVQGTRAEAEAAGARRAQAPATAPSRAPATAPR